MCPVNPLCRGSTTGIQTLKVISYSFPRCPMAVNLNFTILVLLTFALIISEHSPPLTLSSPIIENFDDWTKTCSSNWAHIEGGIWKLLSVCVWVSGYQMLNCDKKYYSCRIWRPTTASLCLHICCQRWHHYKWGLRITKNNEHFLKFWCASGS